MQPLLRKYYDSVYPCELIVSWLRPSEENSYPLAHREFSVSMLRDDGREIYKRYCSVADAGGLRHLLMSQNPIPHKFDIGAVYSKPVERSQADAKPMYREFVLDIDMNDYDDVRTCCQGKSVCSKCWKLIAVAARLIDQTLREDFDFHECLWIFSGRRGAHCWVTDRKAKRLSNEERVAIAGWLDLFPNGRVDFQARADRFRGPFLENAYEKRAARMLRSVWIALLKEQDFLVHSKPKQRFFDALAVLLPRKEIRTKGLPSLDIWAEVKRVAEDSGPQGEQILDTLILWMLYPRLDANVSKEMNHLLKAPFCTHQATGKICCPIRLDRIETFDPSTALTLQDVLKDPEQLEPYLAVLRDATVAQQAARASL